MSSWPGGGDEQPYWPGRRFVPPRMPQGQELPDIIAPAPRTGDYPQGDEYGHIPDRGPALTPLSSPPAEREAGGFLNQVLGINTARADSLPPPPPGFEPIIKSGLPAPPPGFEPIAMPTTVVEPRGILDQLWQGLQGKGQPDSIVSRAGQGLRTAMPMIGALQGAWEGLLGKEPPQTTDLASKVQSIPEKAGYFVGQQVRGAGDLIQRVMNPAMQERMMAGGATPEERIDMLSAAGLGAGRAPVEMPGARPPIRPPITPAQQRLQDFTAVGVTPNAPVIGQGRATALGAQAARVLPFSPIRGGMGRALADTAQAAERTASQYGTAATPFEAGGVTRNATRRFAEDRSQAKTDYDEFFRLMHGAKPAPVSNTVKLLQDFRGRFPNAPGLTGLFTNPKLSRILTELEPRTDTIPAQTSGVLDQFGRPTVTRPPQAVQRGGQLSMPELKELRTQIGYQLENPSFGPEEIPRAQLRQLYASLTRDMQQAAATQSPAAARALNRATLNYGTRMRLLDRIEPLLKPDAPERVFARIEQASRSTSTGDVGLLQAAKKALAPEEWNNIGAAMIRNFGNPSAGAVRLTEQPDFSVDAFASNWNKLSGRAKDLIFGPDTPSSPRAGLEQLVRVVNAQKGVGKLANTSHTYELGAMAGMASMASDIVASLVTRRNVLPDLAMFTGAYGVSKLMMSPWFTRWLYKLPTYSTREDALEGLRRMIPAGIAATAANANDEPQQAQGRRQ